MKFDYAIKILKKELARLNDIEPKLFTEIELARIDQWSDQLIEVIELLKENNK
jgi:hypothetical protein